MLERYAVTVDGRARVVELEQELQEAPEGQGAQSREGNRWRVVVDGRERIVDVRALGDGVWSVVEGVTARLIQVDGVGSKLTVEVSHPDGEPRICVAEVAEVRKVATVAGPAGQAAGPLTLRAPIPGRVVKLLVKAGDGVKAGQTLLVVEAMKMENELRAPRAGTVAAIHVTEGVAVETGQSLVSID